MDTQKLRYSVLCCFLLSLLSGQQGVQGRSASRRHHRITKLFVFGDSYADTGNIAKISPSWYYPYGITFPGKPTGRFSDGRVLTDYVAKFVGVRSPIPYRWRKYGIPLLRYGLNFAVGGTGVFETSIPGPNMTTQIDSFQHLIRDNVFNRSDLESSVAFVSLGGNDYFTYIANNGSIQGLESSFIPKVVTQLTVNLKRIHDLGVRKVAVIALEPSGCFLPSTIRYSFQKCNETENLVSQLHNLLLNQAVAKLNNETKDSAFVILDLYDAFMSVFEGKVKATFEIPLKPCCLGISSNYSCGRVDENGAKKYTICEDPKSAFFWDTAHPTQAGWDAVYSTLQNTLEQLL